MSVLIGEYKPGLIQELQAEIERLHKRLSECEHNRIGQHHGQVSILSYMRQRLVLSDRPCRYLYARARAHAGTDVRARVRASALLCTRKKNEK